MGGGGEGGHVKVGGGGGEGDNVQGGRRWRRRSRVGWEELEREVT